MCNCDLPQHITPPHKVIIYLIGTNHSVFSLEPHISSPFYQVIETGLMQPYQHVWRTHCGIKKSKTARIIKELKNVTLARSPDQNRDLRLNLTMNNVSTYIIDDWNIKRALSRQSCWVENRDTKNTHIYLTSQAHFTKLSRRDSYNHVNTCDAHTVASKNQRQHELSKNKKK